jgi:hypothetical protein
MTHPLPKVNNLRTLHAAGVEVTLHFLHLAL